MISRRAAIRLAAGALLGTAFSAGSQTSRLPRVGTVNYVHRRSIIEFAATQRLPAVYIGRAFVDDGGFLSYGPSLADLWRRAASYVDRILRGAKPSDLPVEQPTKFELTINLQTAKSLGITIPQSLLLRADQVIQ
jgi:putative ABC transport system substrate-binding protein